MCRQDTKAVPTTLTGAFGSKNYRVKASYYHNIVFINQTDYNGQNVVL